MPPWGRVARRKPHLFSSCSGSQFLLLEGWAGDAQFLAEPFLLQEPVATCGEDCSWTWHVLPRKYMRALVLLGSCASSTMHFLFDNWHSVWDFLARGGAFPLEFIPMVGPLAEKPIVLLVVA